MLNPNYISASNSSRSNINEDITQTQILFHGVSPKKASKGIFLSIKKGPFGQGFYFAKTQEEASSFFKPGHLIFKCTVLTGVSLVLTDTSRFISKSDLDHYNFQSIEGLSTNKNSLYLIFDKYQVISVASLEQQKSFLNNYFQEKCENLLCTSKGKNHKDLPCDLNHYYNDFRENIKKSRSFSNMINLSSNFGKKLNSSIHSMQNFSSKEIFSCFNKNCRMYKQYHSGDCMNICKNRNCKFLNNYHLPKCIVCCGNNNCKMCGEWHFEDCIFYCKNQKCLHFDEFHDSDCINMCRNQRCAEISEYHKPPCQTPVSSTGVSSSPPPEVIIICKNKLCINVNQAHEEKCVIPCRDRNCKYFDKCHDQLCNLYCFNKNCLMSEEYHQGNCLLRCRNKNCKTFNNYHPSNCVLPCGDRKCKFFGSFHNGACTLPCSNNKCKYKGKHHGEKCILPCSEIQCKSFLMYHENDECQLPCSNQFCKLFGQFHDLKCSLPCRNKECKWYNSYHDTLCVLPCRNKSCSDYQKHHIYTCDYTCSNPKCKKFSEEHKDDCILPCDNPFCKKFGQYHKDKCLTIKKLSLSKKQEEEEDNNEYQDTLTDLRPVSSLSLEDKKVSQKEKEEEKHLTIKNVLKSVAIVSCITAVAAIAREKNYIKHAVKDMKNASVIKNTATVVKAAIPAIQKVVVESTENLARSSQNNSQAKITLKKIISSLGQFLVRKYS
ncbi:hypothetical protein SteCoe_20957 [Stentor coeruleus]|uniref:PARP catalytic domain-containing protein n=1 Tax=Stentor coeruleus TaxID=5963 RepID=A0A1R2BQP5_9CILI|nr:hypothetical protein SteCoe_20957 [Stentor coeruleus]